MTRNRACTSGLSDRLLAISRDGMPLHYSRIGHGPTLVVCHGALANAADWQAFAVHLSRDCTVILYDCRGRGDNPYSGPFDLYAEVEDLAAIVDAVGPQANILGHSFGDGCALPYALRSGFEGTLLLYEPQHGMLGFRQQGTYSGADRQTNA